MFELGVCKLFEAFEFLGFERKGIANVFETEIYSVFNHLIDIRLSKVWLCTTVEAKSIS